MTLASVGQTLKDFYAPPGARLKQYVVDMNRESAWERETAPRFNVDPHDDNTEFMCRNVGEVPWTYLAHDSCVACDELHDKAASEPVVIAWIAERAKRPPIESDRAKLSDEFAPEWPATKEHPLIAMMRKPTQDPR